MRLVLTGIVLIAYYGLLLLGAFAGPLLGHPVFGAVPLSFVLGVGFIIGVVVLTAFYAWWANVQDADTGDAA